MTQDVYGVGPGQHIPAAVLHRYLTDFAKRFGVFERTRFNTKVVSIEDVQTEGWVIGVASTAGEAANAYEFLAAEKLIVATGPTSTPNMPTYQEQETFTAPLFHAREFCSRSETVDTCATATVIGAGKSALDVAYVFATSTSTSSSDPRVTAPSGYAPPTSPR